MKTSRKIISDKKKISRKKYNSKFKNKNKNTNKRKKSVFRGGANNNPSSNNNSLSPSIKYSIKNHQSQNTGLLEYIFVKENYVKYLTKYHPPFKGITVQSIPDHNGRKLIVYNNKSFRKYVFINGNIYYVYPNTSNPEEPIIYCVFECTNQSITIDTDINLEHTIVITPLELSVDTMQMAINTGSLQIIESSRKEKNERDKSYKYDNPDNTIYLGFVNFPSLVINKVSHSYKSSRKHAMWVNIYEDEETFNHNLKQPYIYDFNIHYQDKLSKKGKYEEITFSNNADYFNEMKNKIKSKMVEMQPNSSDKLKLELEDLFKRVLFGRFVKKEDNTIIQQMDGLEWLMRNTLWLEDYLALTNSFKSHKHNVTTKQKLFDTPKFKEFKDNDALYDCDFTGLDMKYIIIDEFVNTKENGGDGETYVICGYPDKRMKEIILNFWQHPIMKEELDKVHKEQYDNFYEWFSQLFNEFVKHSEKLNLTNINDELYKLYFRPRKIWFYNEINKRYEEMFKNANTKNELKEFKYKEFQTHFENNCKLYFNDIAQQYLNTIISSIKYVFLIFKQNANMSLTPALFNIKELEEKHIPILERINKFIRNEIPIIFDIKQINKRQHTNENIEKSYNQKNTYIPHITGNFIIDNEYKLFYTHCTYGEFFVIKTEYLHTMSNLGHKAHTYANRITIEEIIYSCSLNNIFWKNHKINYDIREYKLIQLKKNNKIVNIKNRSDILFEELTKYYEKEKKIETEKELDIILDLQLFKESKILLMYRNSDNHFIFIYLYDNKFYKLILQPNLKDCLDDIVHILHTKLLIFNNMNKVFKIIFNNELDNDYMKNMFAYNPSTLINIKSPISNIKPSVIDITLYYNTDMKMIKDNSHIHLLMPQLYGSYSPIYTKNINDSLLKTRSEEYEIYKKNNNYKHKNLEDCKEIRLFLPDYKTELQNKELIMNCAYMNVDDCGYNFWEFLNIKENKLIVFIVPYKESKNTPYLGNYYYLDNSHIKMLIAFKTKYYNNNNNCFIMLSRSLSNNTLHFHIIKKDEYKVKWRSSELGLSMLRSININKIINNINTFSLYYKNIDYLIIGV